MTRHVFFTLAIVGVLFSTQRVGAQDAANSIVGVWKMTSWSRKEVDTGKVEQLMGAKPAGIVIYTGGGTVTSFVTAEDRKVSGNKLTTTSTPTAAAKDGRSVIFIQTFERVE